MHQPAPVSPDQDNTLKDFKNAKNEIHKIY